MERLEKAFDQMRRYFTVEQVEAFQEFIEAVAENYIKET
jgi:hypothetical protein